MSRRHFSTLLSKDIYLFSRLSRKVRVEIYMELINFLMIPCNRALIATIRTFGSCPCPRCLVPKSKIPEVGTAFDERRRENSRRVDDFNRNWNVSRARDYIYERGLGVRSAAVERLLAAESYTPTKVRHHTFKPLTDIDPCTSERIFITCSLWFQLF